MKQEQSVEENKLGMIAKHSQKLEELRAKRQSLSKDLYSGLERNEGLYQKLNKENLNTAGKEMSKLQSGINQCNEYNKTIADLAEGLTGELSDFVDFASKGKNYQGMEKLLSVLPFAKSQADRMRIQRLKTQSPRENLKLIIDYANQLFQEITAVREDSLSTFSRLQASVDIITQKISEYEPLEAGLKEKLTAMEKVYKEKEEKFKSAAAAEQALLQVEMNDLHKKLAEVRNEYDQVFTVYNQAQQALESNRQSRNAFEKMVRDLGRQATMIKEKIDNVTEIYLAAPEAVKIMMTTKGMETMDKAINAATDRSVDIITQSAGAVSEATLAREEIQLIDEKVMREYMKRMEETMQNFNTRYDALRTKARSSENERFGAKD